MRKLSIAILSLFFLLSVLALTLQSPWGKKKAISMLQEALEDSGLSFQVKTIQGSLPHQIDLFDVEIQTGPVKIFIGSLEMRLSPLRLLKKEIYFSLIKGDRISWKEETAPPIENGPKGKRKLPFLINVEHFIFSRVQIPNAFEMDLEGHLAIGKNARFSLCDVTARRLEFPDSWAHLLVSTQKDGQALLKLDLKTSDLEALSLKKEINGALSLEANAEGHILSFLGKEGAIEGSIKGSFFPTSIPLKWENWIERNWSFSGSWARNENQTWTIPQVQVSSNLLKGQGKGQLSASGEIEKATFQIQSDSLDLVDPLPLSGKLFGTISLERQENALDVKASWNIPRLKMGAFVVTELVGKSAGSWNHQIFDGTIDLEGNFLDQKWEANTQLTYDSFWKLPSYSVKTDGLTIEGELQIQEKGLLLGTTQFRGAQIHPIAAPLYGQGTARATWSIVEKEGVETQSLRFDGNLTDFYWKELSARELSFYSDVTDPFNQPRGTVYLEMERARFQTLFLENFSLSTESVGENWPLQLFLEGNWEHPLTIRADGFWRKKEEDFVLSLQNATGSFFNHAIQLNAPMTLEYAPKLFRLSEFSWNLGDGTLLGSFNRNEETLEAQVQAKQIPLDFLSLNPLDVAIEGFFDFEGSLKEKGSLLEGDFAASLHKTEVLSRGQKEPLDAVGSLKGHFETDLLSVDCALFVNQTPLLSLSLSLPVHLELWPLKAQIVEHKQSKGHLTFNGKVEDIFDFANLGSHRLEGDAEIDLTLSNTLNHPILSGFIEFNDGYYQNYYTGTELKNIRAQIIGKKENLILKTFFAQDMREQGGLSGTGELQCNLKEKFPFHLDLDIKNLETLSLDLMSSQSSGKLSIRGNLDQATAKGDLHLLNTEISLPQRIPRQLPNLEVTYKNPTKPTQFPETTEQKRYPLFLDLNVDAPDGIFIEGRGLNSEWKGQFHVTGTQTAIAAKGEIDLIKGEFLFSGRRFKLTEGALFFSGVPNQMPFLNLAGQMDVKDITIIARLKGPLNNPQITLHSTPPLSMGGIVSYLLFGQDMSEINSLQALQLANSISSLAGEGPSVLEATRKSLGIDRLEIISVPSPTEEGENTIAVQVGKYVTEDVLVSFSQGAEDANTNISIEVEFRGGLSFVLESQQSTEQGKFTLKWSKNY